MLAVLKQYFYNPLCFKCGSVFVEAHLFCETCFEKDIVPRADLKMREIVDENKTINHFYIFEWIPGESDLLSKMVYQLKSDRCVQALHYYAGILSEQLKQSDLLSQQFNLILPLPGSQKSSVHSQILAQQIAKKMSLEVNDIFVKTPSKISQKTKSLDQRQEIGIEIKPDITNEQITNIKKAKPNVIYVDDILTTGNTFKAAHRVLNIEESACVITLFYRPSLRET